MTKKQAREIQKKFVAKYGCGKIGTIVGGDGALVELGPIVMSCFCSGDKVSGFMCNPPKTAALLVEYVYVRTFPPRATSIRFPRSFMRIPVYYKRGYRVQPQSLPDAPPIHLVKSPM